MMSLNSLNAISRKAPAETGVSTMRDESNFNHSSANNKGRYETSSAPVRTGRKPIRKIMADLQKRIESLQSSRAEYEALEAKINKYNAEAREIKDSLNIIQINKDLLVEYFPEKKKETFKQKVLLQYITLKILI